MCYGPTAKVYVFCLFSVWVDCNLDKMVLTCSQVTLSMWKAKYLSDTEEDPGLSSEDEAAGLLPHRAVARRLLAPHGGAPYQAPFHSTEAVPQPSAPAAAVGAPQGDILDVGGVPDVVSGPGAPPADVGKFVVTFLLQIVTISLFFMT